MYYFVTIGFSICAVVFVYDPSTYFRRSAVFIQPNLAVASIMACRIFRDLKLDLTASQSAESTVISKFVARDIISDPEQHDGLAFELGGIDEVAIVDGISQSSEMSRMEYRSQLSSYGDHDV